MHRRIAALSLAGAALLVAGCGGGETTGRVGADLTKGKQLFTSGCGSCHTLADARSAGQVGPNLDDAFLAARSDGFADSTIFDVVHAQIEVPSQEGEPIMPANIYTGQDAVDVAAYVANVAAKPVQAAPAAPTPAPAPATTGEQGGGGGGGGGDEIAAGKQVFASAGCVSCHTLADAGATGTVGPNLDEAKPSHDLVVERVTNGMGAMPPFKDSLSPEQIQAVAAYVSSVAGK